MTRKISLIGKMTRKFDFKNGLQIELALSVDKYNNPILHILPVSEEGEEIYDNPETLQYELISFVEDVAVGYLEGSYAAPDDVFEMCKSLRRTADILEYKYKKD